MTLDSNTPVLIGVGFAEQRLEDPNEAVEAFELMSKAAVAAARDAVGEEAMGRLLGEIDSIQVPQGMWPYTDPGRLVADRVGAKRAETVLAGIGILQQTLFDNACNDIASGDVKLVAVTGGEARYRALRARMMGTDALETTQEGGVPTTHLVSSDPLWDELEKDRGLNMPVDFFAIIESALRYARGQSLDEHRDAIAALYAGFSRIAAENPHAWKRTPVSAEEIRNPVGKNSMLAFPYTKLHNTSWNVDQASALLFCSVGLAEELGVPRDRWVFPLAAVEANHVVSLSQRPELHRSVGTEVAGKRAFELAGMDPTEVAHADLYSCFPASVQIFAEAVGLPAGLPLTVTGAMPFAGGPLNNYVLQATARMAEVLRADPGSAGLVSCLSGMIGKQAFALWSTEPRAQGFAFADVSEEVAKKIEPHEVVGEYAGTAVVAGYTVTYVKDQPVRAFAICDLPDGRRTVVNAVDPDLLQFLIGEECCGREVSVAPDGSFALVSRGA